MQMHNHNGLHIKKKLSPADYRPDPTCKVTLSNGREVVLPTILFIALREGKVKITPGGLNKATTVAFQIDRKRKKQ